MFQEDLNQKKYGLAVQGNQVVGIVEPGLLSHTDSSEHTHFINFSRDATTTAPTVLWQLGKWK